MNYWTKRKYAFRYAFIGIGRLFRCEVHAKIHLLATLCVIVFGFIFKIKPWEWTAVFLCIGGVLMAEAFNSALEKLADRVSKEKDPLIAAAKDLAAGAVLLFVLAAVAVGLIIFLPKFFC